jgi:hypothetical protein
MVKGFGERQRRRLKGIPGNRLLLESDSPHLPDVAGSINHPAHLFRVAEEVARVRGQSPLDVLRADSVPELVVRLVQGGELEITEKGGWKTEFLDCVGESCGLLAVNGCIQMLDGVE